MKQNNRFCVLALTAVLALTLTACSETADGSAASGSTQATQPAQSTAQQDTSAGTPSASQQTEVLGNLTSSELQELVSGSTTLEQSDPAARRELLPPARGAPLPCRSMSSSCRPLINQLYAVKARAESSLNNTIQSATAEYKALPAAKQTKSRKIAIVMGKAGGLKAMEASCDKEVDDIVNQMRALLTQNGQSTALADEALAAYKAQKSEMVSSLTSKLSG